MPFPTVHLHRAQRFHHLPSKRNFLEINRQQHLQGEEVNWSFCSAFFASNDSQLKRKGRALTSRAGSCSNKCGNDVQRRLFFRPGKLRAPLHFRNAIKPHYSSCVQFYGCGNCTNEEVRLRRGFRSGGGFWFDSSGISAPKKGGAYGQHRRSFRSSIFWRFFKENFSSKIVKKYD